MPTLFNTDTAAVATVDTDEAEVVAVDWDAEVEAANPDADINETLPLPEGGKTYLWSIKLLDRGEDKENPYPGITSKKKPFLNVMFELSLVDESSEFHDFKINFYANSLVFDRRGTSMVHHIMHCIGETLPQVVKLSEMRDRIKKAFESIPAPLVHAELEWKASRKNGPGKYDYEEVVKRARDFPKNPEGDGRSQIYVFVDPKTKQKMELRAQAYISKFLLQGQG